MKKYIKRYGSVQ